MSNQCLNRFDASAHAPALSLPPAHTHTHRERERETAFQKVNLFASRFTCGCNFHAVVEVPPQSMVTPQCLPDLCRPHMHISWMAIKKNRCYIAELSKETALYRGAAARHSCLPTTCLSLKLPACLHACMTQKQQASWSDPPPKKNGLAEFNESVTWAVNRNRWQYQVRLAELGWWVLLFSGEELATLATAWPTMRQKKEKG